MKICRYNVGDKVEYGILEGEEIAALKSDPFAGIERTNRRRKAAEVTLLAPTDFGRDIVPFFH